MTFARSQQTAWQQTELELTPSAEGSRVKTFPLREDVRALKASAAAYGQSTPELLASYDRVTSSWRTRQACLVSGWEEFSETWPRSGLMRSGIAYRLEPLARPTSEIVSGLLPTLTARDFKSDSSSPDWRAWKLAQPGGKPLPFILGGLLNPTWCEWFAGFPSGWTELEPSETP